MLQQLFKAIVLKKQAEVSILLSNKINFQPKVIKKDKEGHFILIKFKIFPDVVSILHIYAPNARASTFFKETIVKLKEHIAQHTVILGDFNTLLSSMETETKQRHKTKQRHVETNRSHETYGFKRYLQNILR
jgi:exonuclease III